MILRSRRHRPVLDVVEVVLDALLERGVAAPAVDLRPAGDAGLHLVAQHVLRNAVLELLDEERPLRPRADERHVAAEHVPELRQLVEVRAAQEACRAACTRGSSSRAQTGPVSRSASSYIERNFHDRRTSLPSRPMRSWRKNTGPRRACSLTSSAIIAERTATAPAAPAAEMPTSIARLTHAVEALQRHVVDVDDRDAVEIFEPRAQRDDLQQVGHDLDVDASRGWRSRPAPSILTCSSSGSAT